MRQPLCCFFSDEDIGRKKKYMTNMGDTVIIEILMLRQAGRAKRSRSEDVQEREL